MVKKAIFLGLVIIMSFRALTAYTDNILNPEWVPEIKKPEWMPDVEGGVTFETKYIWRGQLMVDDFVIQPEASISKYGLTLSYWGNYSTSSSQDKFTENDLVIDYTVNIGDLRGYLKEPSDSLAFLDPFSVSAGHTFYFFPEASGKNFHSEEFYVGVSYDWIISPFMTYYYDYARGAGSYWEFGASNTLDLGNGIDIGTGVTFAYNAGQWGYGYKFAPILFSGEVNVKVLKYFTITPNINYSLAVDRERKDNGLAYGSEFYGGVKVSVAF